jgi:hypothetical protein
MAKGSFSLDLSKFASLTEDKMEKVVIKSFIGLSTDVIKDSPVLSGRLRANWMPDINKFDNSTTEATDKSGAKTIANVIDEANKFKLGDTLTLSQNLPYAIPIEFHQWSKKAKGGMLRLNVLRWQEYVDEQARKLK